MTHQMQSQSHLGVGKRAEGKGTAVSELCLKPGQAVLGGGEEACRDQTSLSGAVERGWPCHLWERWSE